MECMRQGRVLVQDFATRTTCQPAYRGLDVRPIRCMAARVAIDQAFRDSTAETTMQPRQPRQPWRGPSETLALLYAYAAVGNATKRSCTAGDVMLNV